MMRSPHLPPDADGEAFEELAAAYALDALDSDDAASFRSHLTGCPRCQSLLADYRAVAAAFPLTLDEMEASPKLRSRILATAQREPETPIAGQSAATTSVAEHRAAAPVRFKSRLWATAAAALFAVALGLGFWTARLQQQLGEQTATLRLHQDALDAIAAGGRQWTLAGTDAPGASGALVQAPGDAQAYLLIRLPGLPSDRAYQAWVIAGGTPASAGLLKPDPNGPYVLRLERPLTDAQIVAVTEEPSGGSPGPTGPIRAAFTL